MLTEPREPTGDECNEHAKVYEDEQRVGYAIWYPQMGGYCGKAVVVFDKGWYETGPSRVGGCFDAYVWHDGEFPFGDRDDGRSPVCIHHCAAEQFIDFGQTVLELNKQHEKQPT